MSKVKAAIKSKSIPERIKLGEQRVEALKENTEIVLDESVISTFSNAVRKLKEAYDKVASAEIKLKEMCELLVEANKKYTRETDVIVNKLNSTTTHEAKLVSTGFPINKTGISDRNIPLEIPENLIVTNTNFEGQIQVKWKHVKTAHGYIIQYSVDPQFAEINVTTLNVGTISKITIDDIAFGTKIWVRVKAVKANIKGQWSDPAMCIVT